MNNHIRDRRPQRTIDPSTMWDNECRFHRTVAAIEATGGDIMEFYQKVIDGEPWDDTIAESWNPLYKLSDAKPNPSPPEGYSVVSSTGSAVNNARKQRDRSPPDINTSKKLKSVAKDDTLSSSDDSDSNRDDDYIPLEPTASRKVNRRKVQDGRRKHQTHEKKRQKTPQVKTNRDDSSSRVTVRGPRKKQRTEVHSSLTYRDDDSATSSTLPSSSVLF